MMARLPLFLFVALGWAVFANGSVPNALGEAPGSVPGPGTPDPVGYVDGAVFETAVDLRVACPGLDLVFRRHYDSLSCDASPLGAGWTHSCESRVAVRNGETWVFFAGERRPSDSIRRFPALAPGARAFGRDGDELVRLADGRYELVTADRVRRSYNAAGRLASVSTWDGTRVTLVRETPSGPVVRAEHSDGKRLSFSYSDGLLVRVETPDPGVFAELSYGTAGGRPVLVRVVRHDGPRASTNEYAYRPIPPPGTRVAPDDPGLRFLPLRPSPASAATLRPVLREKTDANGLSARFRYIRPDDSQAVRCVRMEMDGGLLETALSYGKGFTLERRPTACGVSAMRLEYDANFRETLRRTGPETTARAYDSQDSLVRLETSDAATGARLIRTASYDACRRPVEVSEAFGGGTAARTRLAWDDRRGIPNRTVSPEGRVREWRADGHDVTVFGAGRGDPRLVSRILCTDADRPYALVTPDGGRTDIAYDRNGYVSGTATEGLPPAVFAHDALGHVSSLSLPGPAGTARTVSFANNWRGRPLSAGYPDGTSESFCYDGNGTRVVRHVDALGRVDVYRWVLGLPVHAGRVINGVTNALFSVKHDPQLNVVAITDPLGRPAESYVLDLNERVVAVTNLEGQAMTRTYALGKMVASETRFDGTQVACGYDSDANLASVAYPDDTLRFGYDRDGLLTSAANASGTVSNCYDAATGWLDRSVGADGSAVSYLHSDGGSVTGVVSAAGTVRHVLDVAGRRVRTDSPAGAVRYGHCPWNGLVAAVTNANGVTATYAYDVMNRVTNIAWRTASGSRLGGFAYRYDALGRIVSRAHDLGGASFDRD